jgi:hypothetical protein
MAGKALYLVTCNPSIHYFFSGHWNARVVCSWYHLGFTGKADPSLLKMVVSE